MCFLSMMLNNLKPYTSFAKDFNNFEFSPCLWLKTKTNSRAYYSSNSGFTHFPSKKMLKISIIYIYYIHPRKLTWHPKKDTWKRRFLLETIILRFHVSFRECIERDFQPDMGPISLRTLYNLPGIQASRP